ncbi:DoxX family membrane protein [Leptospira ellisii]|uniref:DoxX family membrane protein n=1 Tax=Leptospira ellisii TaxID=2023197 RepID=A0A2N0BF11_9LEPT|nr:DoxX family membrane protein [Leptospira ellisii]MDV6236101.1 DoxX family membrane protein [Leptospira ellisii]PJZ94110.1 DoxX family protein [Leptospira ellisii]PKA02577.1 DoxX family protein [Leptospira ellisii]
MKTLELFCRITLGSVFLLFGINKFVVFIPSPPMLPAAAKFIGALLETGYLWKILGVMEIAGACLVLSGRWTALGLVVLAPIVVNIVSYLLILQSGIGVPPFIMSAFLLSSGIYLAFRNKERYTRLFLNRNYGTENS